VHGLAHRVASLLRSVPQRLLYSQDWRRRYGPGARLVSTLRRWRLQLMHPHATLRFEGPVYLGPGTDLRIPDRGTLVVGANVELRHGFRAEIEGAGRIEIGAGSVCSYDVLMQCTTSILIGERCMFGQAAMVVDGEHRFRDTSRPMLEQGFDWNPITIGDDAVITTKCTVMANIGERAFIGANSVVTRDIPPFTVAVGTPARVIEHFGPAEEADSSG
jgi:acetyltransferase-like isoleucine patch superfamily enzyme